MTFSTRSVRILVIAAALGGLAVGAKADDQTSLRGFSADCKASKRVLAKDVKDGQEILLPEGKRYANVEVIVEVDAAGKQTIHACIETKTLTAGMSSATTSKDIRDEEGAKLVTLKIRETTVAEAKARRMMAGPAGPANQPVVSKDKK